jgi:hypothetical protein
MPAATNAPRATAERALIMTVPCHGPLRPCIRRSIGIQRRFPDVFAGAENGFVPSEFCVVPARGKKTLSARVEDSATQPGVQGLWQ